MDWTSHFNVLKTNENQNEKHTLLQTYDLAKNSEVRKEKELSMMIFFLTSLYMDSKIVKNLSEKSNINVFSDRTIHFLSNEE